MKNGFYFLGLCICLCLWASCSSMEEVRDYNEKYTGEYTSRIAFPIGGLGTGMFCVEGSGAISNMNIRHKTEMLNEPTMFAGLYLKGVDNGSIVECGTHDELMSLKGHYYNLYQSQYALLNAV